MAKRKKKHNIEEDDVKGDNNNNDVILVEEKQRVVHSIKVKRNIQNDAHQANDNVATSSTTQGEQRLLQTSGKQEDTRSRGGTEMLSCPFFGCTFLEAVGKKDCMTVHIQQQDHAKIGFETITSMLDKAHYGDDGDLSCICNDCGDVFVTTADAKTHIKSSNHKTAVVLEIACFGCPSCFLLHPTFLQCMKHMMDKNHDNHSFPLKDDNESTALPLPITRECFHTVRRLVQTKTIGSCVCLVCSQMFGLNQQRKMADHFQRCAAQFVFIPESGMVSVLEALVNQPWKCHNCGLWLSQRKRSSHHEVCRKDTPQLWLHQQFKTIKMLLLYYSSQKSSCEPGKKKRKREMSDGSTDQQSKHRNVDRSPMGLSITIGQEKPMASSTSKSVPKSMHNGEQHPSTSGQSKQWVEPSQQAKPKGTVSFITCPFVGCRLRQGCAEKHLMEAHVQQVDHTKVSYNYLQSLPDMKQSNETGDLSVICHECGDMFVTHGDGTKHLLSSSHKTAPLLQIACFGCPTCFLLLPTFTQCMKHMVDYNHDRHAFPLKDDNESTVLPLPITRGCFHKVIRLVVSKTIRHCVCITCNQMFDVDQQNQMAAHLERCAASYAFIPEDKMISIFDNLVNPPWMCFQCGCVLTQRKMSSHQEVCQRGNPQPPLWEKYNTIKELLLDYYSEHVDLKLRRQKDNGKMGKGKCSDVSTRTGGQVFHTTGSTTQTAATTAHQQTANISNNRPLMSVTVPNNMPLKSVTASNNMPLMSVTVPNIATMQNAAVPLQLRTVNMPNPHVVAPPHARNIAVQILNRNINPSRVFPEALPRANNAQFCSRNLLRGVNIENLPTARNHNIQPNFTAQHFGYRFSNEKRGPINFIQPPLGVFQFSGRQGPVTRSSGRSGVVNNSQKSSKRTRWQDRNGPVTDPMPGPSSNPPVSDTLPITKSCQTVCTANGRTKTYSASKTGSSSPTITAEPTQAFLETMAQIILVDLDNWISFFTKLPKPLPDRTFVWGFHAEKTQWHAPVNCHAFKELNNKGCFRLHPQSGNTKDAADFALCMQAGRLDERLPLHIPFTVLSGDKAFSELQRQLANGQRVCHILNPHRVISMAELYALISSITVC